MYNIPTNKCIQEKYKYHIVTLYYCTLSMKYPQRLLI